MSGDSGIDEGVRSATGERPIWLMPGAMAGLFLLLWLLFLLLDVDLDAAVRPVADAHPTVAAATVVLLLGIDAVAPVPNLPVIVLAGSLFGLVQGTALVVAGSMASSALAYLIGRYLPPRFVHRLASPSQLSRVGAWLQGSGRWVLIVARAVPIVPEAVAAAAGAGRMPIGRFAGWTLAGTVPISLALVAAGSMIETAENALLVGAVAVLVTLAGYLLLTRRA